MSDLVASDGSFSPNERELIRTVVELMVPEDAQFGVPSAADERILSQILLAAERDVEQIKTAIGYAQNILAARDNTEDAISLLEGRRELAPLVAIVMQSYYSDPRVMQALGKEARAPFPKGYQLPEDDWSMLEPVQARGKIWRDAD